VTSRILLGLLAGLGVLAALVALRAARSRPTKPIAAGPFEADVPFGLTLEAPTEAHLPAPDAHDTLDYPVAITAHVSLPTTLWPAAKDRLLLVVTGPDGQRRENTFAALDQPLGMNISRHYEPPSQLPRLTPALLAQHTDAKAGLDDSVQSSFRANLALLDFPSGTATYHAQATLDDLRSNELEIAITVGGR
jgi:hypothetical protein